MSSPTCPEDVLYREWLPEQPPAATDGELNLVVTDEAHDLPEMWVLATSS